MGNVKPGDQHPLVVSVEETRPFLMFTFGINTEHPEDMENSPLAYTSFFRDELAKAGGLNLLRKCGNYHLLIPPKGEYCIPDITEGRYCHIVFGTIGVSFLFDDFSGTPFIIQLGNNQIKGLMDDVYDRPQRKGSMFVYTKGVEHPDEMMDEVNLVCKLDLWASRSFDDIPTRIRKLSRNDISIYEVM